MTRGNPAGSPGYLAGLLKTRAQVESAPDTGALKKYAKVLHLPVRGVCKRALLRLKVVTHLDNLITTNQGSTAAAAPAPASPEPMEIVGETPEPKKLRLSFLEAACQTPKGHLTPLGKVPQRRSPAISGHVSPIFVGDSQEGGRCPPRTSLDDAAGAAAGAAALPQPQQPAQQQPQQPAQQRQQCAPHQGSNGGNNSQEVSTTRTFEAAQQPSPPPSPLARGAAAPPPAAQQQELDATRRQLNAARQRIEQLEAEVDSLKQLRAEVDSLKQRQQHTHGTALKAVQGVEELRRGVENLQGEASRTQKLEEQLGHVHSHTLQLREQQHREECQRAVVFKTPDPLPAQRSQQAKTAGEFLSQLIGQQVTVLRVQELSGKSRAGGGSPRGGQRRHVYKLLLPSSAARDALLRAKASKLRNTPYTIDVCLTPKQAANKAERLPAAKAARDAGQRVQWRYDSLYIDGQPHGRDGPPLSPASQQQQQGPSATAPSPQSPARSPAGSSQAEAAAPPAQDEPEEGEFQEVKSKRKRRRQPSASTAASGRQPLANATASTQPAARPAKVGGRATAAKASGTRAPPPRASAPTAGKENSRAGGGGSSGSGRPRGDRNSNNSGSRKATNSSELTSERGARPQGGQHGDGSQQQQQQQRRASPTTTTNRA